MQFPCSNLSVWALKVKDYSQENMYHYPFYKWNNWEMETLSDLPKAT